MFDYHKNKERYFNMQYLTARDYILPFIQKSLSINPGMHVLEIGCAEAGVLKAFIEKDCICTGLDLNESRIQLAKEFHREALQLNKIRFSTTNLYDLSYGVDFPVKFDVVVLKDVIEHIPDQLRFIKRIRELINPGGWIFFAFPPWQMPFGGHQQMCRSSWMARLPWLHLLPSAVYRKILEMCGESPAVVDELMEIKETGLSIAQFEQIAEASGLEIVDKLFYLTNPIYKFKFGLKVRRVSPIFNYLPYFRNFYTTAAYYLMKN